MLINPLMYPPSPLPLFFPAQRLYQRYKVLCQRERERRLNMLLCVLVVCVILCVSALIYRKTGQSSTHPCRKYNLFPHYLCTCARACAFFAHPTSDQKGSAYIRMDYVSCLLPLAHVLRPGFRYHFQQFVHQANSMPSGLACVVSTSGHLGRS